MPFEINNLKIGFTTNFYKTKKKKTNKQTDKLEALALVPFSWLKVVTLLTYALKAPCLRAFKAP